VDVVATLIVLFRMVRIMHGIYISIEENKIHKIEKLKIQRDELKTRVDRLEEEHGRMVILLQRAKKSSSVKELL